MGLGIWFAPTHAMRVALLRVSWVAVCWSLMNCDGSMPMPGQPPAMQGVEPGATGGQAGGMEQAGGSGPSLGVGGSQAMGGHTGAGDDQKQRELLALAETIYPVATDKAIEPRVYRLTALELANTLNALFGAGSVDSATLPKDSIAQGFSNFAGVLRLDAGPLQRYLDLVQQLTTRAVQMPSQFAGCNPAEDTCIQAFARRVARLAWRYEPSAAELAPYFQKFNQAKGSRPLAEALAILTRSMLASHRFFFRVEERVAAGSKRVLSQLDQAEALALTLTSQPPDATLLADAAAGRLDSTKRREHALRLLETPAGQAKLSQFALEWFGLADYEFMTKDQAKFPEFNDALRKEMYDEVRQFATSVMRTPSTSLKELMLNRQATLTPAVAKLYGLPNLAAPQSLELSTDRRGILSRAALLAYQATESETVPTRRGTFILGNVLCIPPPQLPRDANISLPNTGGRVLTKRDLFELHVQDAACKSCHELFDPPGFAFEKFDALGRQVSTERGLPINARVMFMFYPYSTNGHVVDGPGEAIDDMIDRPELYQCAVRQAYRFGMGREESDAANSLLRDLYRSFIRSNGSIKELFANLVASEFFVERSN
jgi:hypothetical protein